MLEDETCTKEEEGISIPRGLASQLPKLLANISGKLRREERSLPGDIDDLSSGTKRSLNDTFIREMKFCTAREWLISL